MIELVAMKHCENCGEKLPLTALDARGYCEVCAPIMKLRDTLKAQGRVSGKPIPKPEVRQATLPYADL